jgi:hypothetical protein
MIAVVGRNSTGAAGPIARRAARAGARVELIATVPVGRAGDAQLVELASAGVGHAAVLRSPAAALEAADLELALRFVPDVRVVILADDEPGLALAATDAAAWSGASLIRISRQLTEADPGQPTEVPSQTPAGAFVLAGPPRDPDEAFAGLVASLAVRLDAGEDAGAAWRGVSAGLGLEPVSPGPTREPLPLEDPPA